ncbi:MAG: class I SAM-dependent methyltransferase [bacterium]
MSAEKVDFNKYAEDYEGILDKDLKIFGEESGYFAEYKVKIVHETSSIIPTNILEYGCGIGLNLGFFKKYFPQSEIHGCDISQKSIEIASLRNKEIDCFIIDEETLRDRKEKYDLIFVSCVFHHIAPALRKNSIKQIKDLLKKGGALYIFEHNPINPVTQKIVRECVWDEDAILLDMKETISLMKDEDFEISDKKYYLFFPARLNFLRPLEKFLGIVPLGGQYFVKGLKK